MHASNYLTLITCNLTTPCAIDLQLLHNSYIELWSEVQNLKVIASSYFEVWSFIVTNLDVTA